MCVAIAGFVSRILAMTLCAALTFVCLSLRNVFAFVPVDVVPKRLLAMLPISWILTWRRGS